MCKLLSFERWVEWCSVIPDPDDPTKDYKLAWAKDDYRATLLSFLHKCQTAFDGESQNKGRGMGTGLGG